MTVNALATTATGKIRLGARSDLAPRGEYALVASAALMRVARTSTQNKATSRRQVHVHGSAAAAVSSLRQRRCAARGSSRSLVSVIQAER